MRGTGAITGAGGVTLASANAKLCGSLTIASLTAMSGGIIGENWDEDAIALSITNSLMAAGTLNLKNGSFTIGADCVVSNAANVADTTDAVFSIAANANLVLEKAVTVGGLTVATGGTITVAASSAASATLTVSGTATYAGTVNFVIDRTGGNVSKVVLLRAGTVPTLANCTVTEIGGAKQWILGVEEDPDNAGVYTVFATPKGGFFIKIK